MARATTLYVVDLPGADTSLLDLAVSRLPVTLQGSGFTRTGGGYVMFRAEDDEAAKAIAQKVGAGLEVGLRTGLGAHHRAIWGTDYQNPLR